MARLLTHFPNRSNIEFRHETYPIDLKDIPQLAPSVREWKSEETRGVPPTHPPHLGTPSHSSNASVSCPTVDSKLPAGLVLQDESHRKKGQPLRSRSAKGWKRTSSVPTAERVKVSSQIQQILRFKSSPKLQLPSFELLGIANPHPDTFSLSRRSTAASGELGGRWPSDRQRRDTKMESLQLNELTVEGQTTPGHETTAPLTPPDEHTIPAPIEEHSRDPSSTSMTDFNATKMALETLSITGATSGAGEGTTASEMGTEGQREATSGERTASAQSSSRQEAEISGSESGQGWLEQAIAVACEFEWCCHHFTVTDLPSIDHTDFWKRWRCGQGSISCHALSCIWIQRVVDHCLLSHHQRAPRESLLGPRAIHLRHSRGSITIYPCGPTNLTTQYAEPYRAGRK